MEREEGLRRLGALGFSASDTETLWAHFDDAEQRGKLGHGHSRIPWLETLDGFDAAAQPVVVVDEPGYQRWNGNGAIGYLVLAAAVARQIAEPPAHARVVVCERTFPTGMLGHHVRRLADAGLVGVLTATSPARLGPAGGPKVAGTNPLAIGIPGGVVVDVSMGAVTWGDVIAGRATEEQLVPFGGEQWHKAFALALGLQLLVDSLVSEAGHGAVLVVAQPEADPVPALRQLGIRLPGSADRL
ncbi:MAG TPA: Ldh family oxidoreductase [Gaiellaceae bacterium]|nr:Ldh family oxidoreductase [Gaiellaceae bacterium]